MSANNLVDLSRVGFYVRLETESLLTAYEEAARRESIGSLESREVLATIRQIVLWRIEKDPRGNGSH